MDFEHIQALFQTESTGLPDGQAVLTVPEGSHLHMSVDTLVAGVHFGLDDAPASVGHKSLAVNLSDMAAMGAEPVAYTLALALPELPPAWIEDFHAGMQELAQRAGVRLLTVAMVPGPLAVTVQVYGLAPPGQCLTRAGAKVGDGVYVSGTLGDAGLALRQRLGQVQLSTEQASMAVRHLDRPEPRLAAGLALRGVASAAIDISDGLAADLGHVLSASGVGASLAVDRLPLSPVVRAVLDVEVGWRLAMSAGDDYELCFTVPPVREPDLVDVARRLDLPLTRVGVVEAEAGMRLRDADGRLLELDVAGYDHFAPRGQD